MNHASADGNNMAGREEDLFVTTQWTAVRAAAGMQSGPQSARALEGLCRVYWFPLYAYVRRRGHSREDAEDLTQAFFARLLEKGFPADLSDAKGKFRAFLLACLKNFLANAWDKSRTQKRGGHANHLPLDWDTADSQFASAPAQNPDRAFDREWAMALLGRVLERLRADCADEGRAEAFEVFKVFLSTGTEATSHADNAAKLGVSEGAARVAVHRLRKRYRQMLREEVARTLADPSRVDEEMRALFAAFQE